MSWYTYFGLELGSFVCVRFIVFVVDHIFCLTAPPRPLSDRE